MRASAFDGYPSQQRARRTTGCGRSCCFIVGAALCFVPLFDVLGYECVLRDRPFWRRWRGRTSARLRVWRERRERGAVGGDARPRRGPARGGVAVAGGRRGGSGGRWRLPLVAILPERAARAQLRLRWPGSRWFVMLPMLSAAMGAGAGVVAGLVARVAPAAGAGGAGDRDRRRLARRGACGASTRAPPIFGYDPFAGYFAGHALRRGGRDHAAARVGAAVSRLPLLAGWLALCALLLDARRSAAVVRRRCARGRSRARSSRCRWPRRCGTRARRSASPTPPATSRGGSAASCAPRTSSCTIHRQGRSPRTSPRTPRTTSFAGTSSSSCFGRTPARAGARVPLRLCRAEARAHGRGAYVHRQAVAARDLPAARRLAAPG